MLPSFSCMEALEFQDLFHLVLWDQDPMDSDPEP